MNTTDQFPETMRIGILVYEAAAKEAEYDWRRNPQQPIHYPQQAKLPEPKQQ